MKIDKGDLIYYILLIGVVSWLFYLIVFDKPSEVEAGNLSTEIYELTAYCPCRLCCGKWSDGLTASGRSVDKEAGLVYSNGQKKELGIIACNILPFDTLVKIEGLGYFSVEDRGARRLFDGKKKIDILFDSHEEALRFGKQYREVRIL